MPFEQKAVNYAAEYGRALANAYPYLSYFGDIWASPMSEMFKPGHGKTMYIPSMSVSGARAADRDNLTGQFSRNWNNNLVPFTLEQDREWDTLVDPMDIDETNMIASIANISRTFNEQQKIPEMDAYLAAKIATIASENGNADTTVLTAENILSKWDAYRAQLVNARVPLNRVTCKMTPECYNLLKNAAGITRFVDLTGNTDGNLNRKIARMDDIVIREVPKDLMMTAYNFTNGWAPAADAKQINMEMVDIMAIAAPVKHDTAMTSAPTAQSKGKWLYYERFYYGATALAERKAGVLANVSA